METNGRTDEEESNRARTVTVCNQSWAGRLRVLCSWKADYFEIFLKSTTRSHSAFSFFSASKTFFVWLSTYCARPSSADWSCLYLINYIECILSGLNLGYRSLYIRVIDWVPLPPQKKSTTHRENFARPPLVYGNMFSMLSLSTSALWHVSSKNTKTRQVATGRMSDKPYDQHTQEPM